jgi:hypothetical protein
MTCIIHKPFLKKLFGNIKSLELSVRLTDITHIVSAEGEKLEMNKQLRVRGATEQWLVGLENGMFDTVKKHLKVSLPLSITYGPKEPRMDCGSILLHLRKNRTKKIIQPNFF